MAKTFKKGDVVTYISHWNLDGTVYFRHAVVYSCGKKQMVLTDAETGEEMGRHFSPKIGSTVNTLENNRISLAGGTFPRMTDDEAIETGMKIAAAIREHQNEHFAKCLAGGHGGSYDAAIRRDIARLHDFEVKPYSELRF